MKTYPSDEQIYRWYLGDFKLNKKISSPIPDRPQRDRGPSLVISNHQGTLFWKDFGLPSPIGAKAIHFVMHMQQIYDFNDAVEFIRDNIDPSKVPEKGINNIPAITYYRPSKPKFDSNYTKWELDYWAKFHQNKYDLIREKIYGLRNLSWGDNSIISSTIDDPAFIYDFGPDKWKCYRPSRAKDNGKFLSNNISQVIEGLHSLDWENLFTLIICSSTKDRLAVKKAGFQSINPTSETSYKPFHSVIDKLNYKSALTVVMFDSDSGGLDGSKEMNSQFGFPYVNMIGKLGKHKDFAEFIEEHGPEVLNKRINYLLKNHIIK